MKKLQPVVLRKLKRKVPLNRFPNRILKKLLKVAVAKKYTKNDVLFSVGDTEKRAAFLIKGSVIMESVDGRVIHVDHDDDLAQFALSNLKPRMYTAIAATGDTVLFWIKDEILDMASQIHGIKVDHDPERTIILEHKNSSPTE